MAAGENSITLYKRDEPTKNGDLVYRRDGVRASVYVNKRNFLRGEAPDVITVTSDDPIFRRPVGEIDPEVAAARVQQLQAKADRKRDQAGELLEKARTLSSQAEQEAAKL